MEELPNNLIAEKSVLIKYGKIRRIGNNIEVGTNFSIVSLNEIHIGKNLKVHGTLSLGGVITSIPDDLEATTLEIIAKRIEHIPKTIKVKRLDLTNSSIAKLPSGLKVNAIHVNKWQFDLFRDSEYANVLYCKNT